MGKKLLTSILINLLIMLNPWSGFGQCPSSVTISADPGKTICEGTNVTFTANPSGGDSLEYQWQIDGSDIQGETNQTFSTTGLTNGQKVRVEVTTGAENDTCSISSSEITMTVNTLRTPTVTIAAHEDSLCAGDNISFSANNTNGGSTPLYEWFINNSTTVSGTGASVTFSSSDFNEGENYVRVRLTSSLECVTSETAEETSSTFTLKPDATISAPGNVNETTCINSSLNPISFNIGGGGTGATTSGLPPGISGSYNAGTYTLSGTPTTAGEFNYTVTTTGTCAQTSATGTITVNPDATLSLSSGNADQTVCAAGGVADGNIEPITYAVGETGTGAEVTGLPEGISGTFSNGIFTISGSSSETGTHNFTVSATGTCGNSSALTGSIIITGNSAPSVSISSSDADNEICEGESVTFTATPTNGGSSPDYQWQVNGNNAGSNSNTFTTTSLTDGQAVTVVMTSNEACITESTANSNSIITKVNPNLEPSVSIDASDTEFCTGDEVTYTAVPVNGGASPAYEWKVGSTIVGSEETFTSSDLTNGQSVTVTLISSETCVTTSTAVSEPVVTIVNENLVPSVSIESNDDNNTICTGSNIIFTATPTHGGTNPEYQWQVNGNASGAITTSNTFSSASLNNGDIVSAVLISKEECLAENNVLSNEIAVQVDSDISGETPVWDYSNSSYNPTAICPSVSGLIYKIEPIAGATSYDWNLPSGWTITNGEGTNEITVTASVNASAGDVIVKGRTECGVSLQNSTTVTTGTAAHVDAGPDQTVCPGTSVITLAGEIGGVITQQKDWDWFASVNGGEFTSDGFSNGGNSLDGTYTIPTSVQNGGTVTIRIKSVQPAGDCDIKVDEMTLTIESAATISDATNKDQTVCIDSAIEDISFTVGGAGKGAETTGLPKGITGNFADGIYTLSGTPTVAGTFSYTVTTTGDCENDSISGSITVNDRPTLTKPEDVFVCSGAETSVINFGGSSISGTTYEWTNDNNSIGLAESGTGDINSFTAINNSTEPVIANISVTPIANNCEGTPEEFTITVYPSATFTAPENLTVCNGENLQDIVFAGSTVDGSTYKWTNSNTAIGLPAEGTGNISSFTASNTTSEPINANITVIPVANGCEGTPQEFTITVNPTPAFSAPENQIICNGEDVPEIVFSGETVSGSNFNWTNDNTTIGLAESGSGNIPAFTAVNNGSEPVTAIITVTPAANQCEGEPKTFEIIVNPTSTVNPIENMVVCNGEDIPEVAFTSAVSGTTFSWTNSNPDIGLAASGTGNLPVFSAENNTEQAITATITVIPTANECEGNPFTFDITVNSSAIIDAGPDLVICSNSTATMAASLGGSATSGTWTTSGSGSFSDNTVNSVYTPSAMDAANGLVTLTYTSNDPDGPCEPVSDSLKLSINEEVVITTQPENIGICSTEPSELSVIASGDNLTYEWRRTDNTEITNATGINSPTLSFNNTTSTNSGEYYVIVKGEDSCQEITSDAVTINVDEDIIIEEPVTEVPICGDGFSEVTMKFIAHANGAPLTFTWYKDNVEVDAALDENITITTQPADENGRYEGTLEIVNVTTDYNGDYYVEVQGPEDFTCSTAVTNPFQLRLNEVPAVPEVEDLVVCQNETPEDFTVISGTNLKWYATQTGNDPYDGTPVPPTNTPGQTSYWVSQTPDVCESERSEVIVTVKETPQPPTTAALVEYCLGETSTELIAEGGTGTTINWYDAQDATQALASAPIPVTDKAGTTSYWVSQTLEGCESDRAEITVTINPLPEIAITADEGMICKGNTATLTATGATTYVWYKGEEEIGSGASIEVSPETTTTYNVIGTDGNTCSNTTEITIEVEEPSLGGIITAPASVCIGTNSGSLVLSEFLGEIQRWEKSTDGGITWTTINESSETLEFTNLSEVTSFRAFIKNGVCEEVSSEVAVIEIDPLPVGGELNFDGFGRVLETCSNPGPDYTIPLILTGEVGEVISWRYKENSATDWSTITEGGENFTGKTLTAEQIRNLGVNQSTIFEVEIGSGACNPNVYSQNATLSIISSDIAPDPVSVTPGDVCIGELVTLSASTGYGSGPGFEEGGAFDFSSITNHGWRIKDGNGNESNFDSSADNGVAAIWLRTNPLPLNTAYLSSPYNIYSQNWDSSAGNEGNKGFAIVSGPNPSTLETSIFNLYAVEDPVLTFDQGYVLTPGSAIYVEISTDGGNTYQTEPLYFVEVDEAATEGKGSGNYDSFGDDSPGDRSNNKITLDLTEYAGLDNLRIRFRYEGVNDGNVWAVDEISLPVESTNVDMVWTDYTDPENPVVIGSNNSEQWTPTLIGWNDFEIRTKLIFDSTGEQCPVVENWETISVFVFDKYTSTATAVAGSCGIKNIQLNGVVLNNTETEVTEFPTRDDYTAKWEVVASPEEYNFSETHFTTNGESTIPPVNNPEAVFSPGMSGEFTLRWALERNAEDDLVNETCPPTYNDVSFTIQECIALDFDGVDDYVDLGNNYTGNYFIEAWIRPFDRPLADGSGNTDASNGVIFSSSGFEIKMENLPADIQKNSRWYHIAVADNGNLWVDGIPSGSITVTGSGINNTSIGARYDANNKSASNFFSGWIEEVRIWNTAITEDQIRFMMNQRLYDNGTQMGVEIPMDVPGGLSFADLAGYYQFLAQEELVAGGTTPDLAQNAVPGRLMNMETMQENTAPLPYTSRIDGQDWETDDTWTHFEVWDAPNSKGINNDPIEWNIVRTNHDINSGDKHITVLGLKSETPEKVLKIAAPGDEDEYNPGRFLRVTHYLLLDGNIDLVGESQLLQDSGSILDAASQGWLKRDQQGVANSYNYNYWSSPVSVGTGNVPYTIAGVMRDGTNPRNPVNLDFGAPYAYADGGPTNPRKISNYWLHKFRGTANVYGEWIHIGSTGTLNVGEGFTMKGTSGPLPLDQVQNYTFQGTPNNGDFNLTIGENQNYLIGNPYPSAIDADQFILDNLNTVENSTNNANVFNGALYFWDHFGQINTHILKEYVGGYATYSLASDVGVPAASIDERINANNSRGSKTPKRYIPVGQSFFINTVLDEDLQETFTVTGGDVTFKNSQRFFVTEANGSSTFLRPEEREKGKQQENLDQAKKDNRYKIRLNFRSPSGYHRQILVTADANTSTGFDLGYDAMLLDNNKEDMFWLLNGHKLVIQAVPDFNADRSLPLGMVISKPGNISVEIEELENMPEDSKVYIRDNTDSTYYNISEKKFNAPIEPGYYGDKYDIVFDNGSGKADKEKPVPGPIGIKYSMDENELSISNPELHEIEKVSIYSLLGQEVEIFEEVATAKEVRLPVKRNYSSAVYIVKVFTENETYIKKVILK